ncbi:MAG TPA: cellulose binding domain-containing protein [Anaeromyxobacter sp.]|nr:cellulose binding domain-containing protein [Anaeromyxobacter sp.]
MLARRPAVLAALLSLPLLLAACGAPSADGTRVSGGAAAAGDEGPLAVVVVGTGAGLVTSDIGGISCPGSCSTVLPAGTVVTLTATPLAGSAFTSWAGFCGFAGQATTCVVEIGLPSLEIAAIFRLASDPSYLTVNKPGAGAGLVTSSPEGVYCGSTCSAAFPPGSVVTLTAAVVPGTGSTFAGWTGACTGTSPTCTVTLDQSRYATATFDSSGRRAPLTVKRWGSGAGAVSSGDGGIDCGTLCSQGYLEGAVVTLTAAAESGSVFTGWGPILSTVPSPCTGTSPTCVITTTGSNLDTVAYFDTTGPVHTLSVDTNATPGAGVVFTSTYNIQCPNRCSAAFAAGTEVTLWASTGVASTFTGWGGACTGTDPYCVVSMTEDRAVTATFDIGTTYRLNVHSQGSGTIAVSGHSFVCPAATSCGYEFPAGTVVTLTATPSSTTTFAGWSGDCSGTGPCTLEMTEDHAVAATFTAPIQDYTLTVSRAGTGTGRVTSTPAGIDCGTTCSAMFRSGTVVTLTATPSPGHVFGGWSGACAGSSSTCVVTMTQARMIAATFLGVASTGGCQVSYRVTRQWRGGFTAAFDLRNTGTTPWKAWTVTWTWPDANQRITGIWNATATQSGQAVAVRNMSYNGTVPAGGSYGGVGFIGTWSGANPVPPSFSVNGVPCD